MPHGRNLHSGSPRCGWPQRLGWRLRSPPRIGHPAQHAAIDNEEDQRGWQTKELQRRVQGEGGAWGDSIRGALTVAKLLAKHGGHQTLINTWKRQALEGMSVLFAGKAKAKAAEKEVEIEKLHAKIGELVVERDFLAKASGRRVCPEGER